MVNKSNHFQYKLLSSRVLLLDIWTCFKLIHLTFITWTEIHQTDGKLDLELKLLKNNLIAATFGLQIPLMILHTNAKRKIDQIWNLQLIKYSTTFKVIVIIHLLILFCLCFQRNSKLDFTAKHKQFFNSQLQPKWSL